MKIDELLIEDYLPKKNDLQLTFNDLKIKIGFEFECISPNILPIQAIEKPFSECSVYNEYYYITVEGQEKFRKAYLDSKIEEIDDFIQKIGSKGMERFFTPKYSGIENGICKFIDKIPQMQALADKISDDLGITTKYIPGHNIFPKDFNTWYVEEDPSIRFYNLENSFGAEIVGKPYPLKEALSILARFFGFMKKNKFKTNSSSGMHVNISIENMDLDYVKIFAFMNESYLQSIFNKNEKMQYYGKSYDKDVNKFSDILNQPWFKNPEKVIAYFRKMFDSQLKEKYRSFNFSKPGLVEFRIIRGENYFERLDEISKMVLQFANLIRLASEPELYKDQYIKKLYKIIQNSNKEPEKNVNMEILDKLFKTPFNKNNMQKFMNDNSKIEPLLYIIANNQGIEKVIAFIKLFPILKDFYRPGLSELYKGLGEVSSKLLPPKSRKIWVEEIMPFLNN